MQLTVIEYTADRAELHEIDSLEEAFPFRETPSVTWLGVTGFNDVAALKRIGQEYGIHPLVMEDVLNTYHRPKAEAFMIMSSSFSRWCSSMPPPPSSISNRSAWYSGTIT